MTNCEIIKAVFAALESEEPKRAASYLTEDFFWMGTLPRPLDKQRFISLMTAVKKGFPDYTLNIKICQELNDRIVKATMEPLGTHTGTLALPGITPVKPTGKTVALPRHALEITFHSDRISRIRIESASGGGVAGMLESLGVEVTEEMLERMFK